MFSRRKPKTPLGNGKEKRSKGDKATATTFHSGLEYGSAFEYGGDESCIKQNYKSIFTYTRAAYADEEANEESDSYEYGGKSKMGPGVYWCLVALSCLFLILCFPILGWFFIKHLASSERLIVFRLGQRLKTKGPGFVPLLPIVDRFHRIRLGKKQLSVPLVSGITSDEAVVEVSCTVEYHIDDPELAVTRVNTNIDQLLCSEASSALVTAVRQFKWSELNGGGGRLEMASELRHTINRRCGVWGMDVTQAEVSAATLVREPPGPTSILDRIDLSTVGQQLAMLTPLLTSATAIQLQTQTPDTSTTSISSGTNPEAVNTFFSRLEVIKQQALHQQREVTSRDTASCSSSSHVERNDKEVIGQLMERVRTALANRQMTNGSKGGGVAIQLMIRTSDGEVMPVFVDTRTGEVGEGRIEKPTVATVLTCSDLCDLAEGRLDPTRAFISGKVKLAGDMTALVELKGLLL